MIIQVHIESLILEGLPLESRQGKQLQACIETELARLLTGGMPGVTGGAFPKVQGSDLQFTPNTGTAQLGKEIAHSIHSGIALPPGPTAGSNSMKGDRGHGEPVRR